MLLDEVLAGVCYHVELLPRHCHNFCLICFQDLVLGWSMSLFKILGRAEGLTQEFSRVAAQ